MEPGPQPQRAPASCPCPSLCQALSLFASLHLLPPLTRIRASAHGLHPATPPCSCLGSSFPRSAVSQLLTLLFQEQTKTHLFTLNTTHIFFEFWLSAAGSEAQRM